VQITDKKERREQRKFQTFLGKKAKKIKKVAGVRLKGRNITKKKGVWGGLEQHKKITRCVLGRPR